MNQLNTNLMSMDFSFINNFKYNNFNFQHVLIILISFSFIYKIQLATIPLMLILVLNFRSIDSYDNKFLSLLNYVFVCIYFLYFLTYLTKLNESINVIIKPIFYLLFPLLFRFKKFSQIEIIYFYFSFFIFQILHLLYVDFIFLKAFLVDNQHDFNYLNSLVESNFLVERPYLSLNALLTIVALKLLFDKNKITKAIFYLSVIFIVISLFLIAARLAMFISLALVFFILINTKIKFKTIIIYTTILLICILPFRKYAYERLVLKDGEPRIIIWDCAYKLINDPRFNFLLGDFSENETNKKLIDCYNSKKISESKYWWIGKNNYRYNTHNQYLGFLCSYGFLGLFLFLMIYFIQLASYFKKKNIYSLLIVIVFVSQSFFENILNRQLGIYLFLWFNYFVILHNEKNWLNE